MQVTNLNCNHWARLGHLNNVKQPGKTASKSEEKDNRM